MNIIIGMIQIVACCFLRLIYNLVHISHQQFSNYAFDVHTVYQWGLNDHYHYFQTTHLTYTQLVYQWGLNDRYHYFQTTHLTYTQLVYQWGLNDCYHYSHTTHLTYTHPVYQCKMNDRYRYFQTTHLTYTQFINDDWIDCCLLTKWLGVKETKNHNGLLHLGKLWNFTHISIKVSPCELRDDDSFLAVCSF